MFQKTRVVAGTLCLGAALFTATVLSADGQPPAGKGEPPPKGEKAEKGKGGPGRGGRPPFGAVLPPFLMDELEFTDEQRQAVATLQKEVDTQLGKILTDAQKKQLKELRDRGPGGPGGPGGPPGGEKGGPPGKGGKGPPRE